MAIKYCFVVLAKLYKMYIPIQLDADEAEQVNLTEARLGITCLINIMQYQSSVFLPHKYPSIPLTSISHEKNKNDTI